MKSPSFNYDQGNEKVLQEASLWQVRHEAGLTRDEQKAFATWLAENPRHALAWDRVIATAQSIDRLRRDEATTMQVLSELMRRRQRRKWKVIVGGAMTTLVAAAAVWFFVFNLPNSSVPVQPTRPEMIVAEVSPKPARAILHKAERRLLEDGSQVDLNTNARIEIVYTTDRREVTLLSGEALFRVEKDPRRPFIVRSGALEVRAVGTAFAVQRTGANATVLVTEGRVGVVHPSDNNNKENDASSFAPVLLDAGNLLVISATGQNTITGSPQAVSSEAINRRLAWTRPRLLLDETALSEAISALNDENHTHIQIADEALAELRLTGTFFADDPEGFVRLLESNYRIAVERLDRGAVMLRSR